MFPWLVQGKNGFDDRIVINSCDKSIINGSLIVDLSRERDLKAQLSVLQQQLQLKVKECKEWKEKKIQPQEELRKSLEEECNAKVTKS